MINCKGIAQANVFQGLDLEVFMMLSAALSLVTLIVYYDGWLNTSYTLPYYNPKYGSQLYKEGGLRFPESFL